MSDTLTCWICRKPIHRLEKRIQSMRGVIHLTCNTGFCGWMAREASWRATGGYPPFRIEDQAALLIKGYYWKDGLRRAVMVCRSCEVFLFDRDKMAEFRTEHAAHNVEIVRRRTLRVCEINYQPPGGSSLRLSAFVRAFVRGARHGRQGIEGRRGRITPCHFTRVHPCVPAVHAASGV